MPRNATLRMKNILIAILFIAAVFEMRQLYDVAFARKKLSSLTSSLRNEELSLLLHTQEVMLNSQQLQRLRDVRSGKLTRRDIELVIARYDEDVVWSDFYSSIRTIYDKNDNQNHRLDEFLTGGKLVRIRNLGRESYTYLYHIVHNYDSLASVTVFTQGTAPAHGYLGHRTGGGHLFANSTIHDYVLSDDGWFVFTGAIYIPTLAHLLRTGYNKGHASREQAQSKCPTPPLDAPGGNEYKFDLDDWPHLKVFRHIASRCASEDSSTCQGYAFWNKFVKLPPPPEDIIYFAQGAVFAATREQIRRRPLSDYVELLKEVEKSVDPSAGFFLEWFWYYIVTSDTAPCPSHGTEFDWAKERPFFKTLPFQERVKFTQHIDATKRPKKKRTNFCLW